MKYSTSLNDHAIRQLIDTETIFIAWRTESLRKNPDAQRVASLYEELRLACRLNRAHQIGQAPSFLVNHAAGLAMQGYYCFQGLAPLHTYSLLAGVRWKPRRSFQLVEPAEWRVERWSEGFATGLLISSFGATAWSAAPAPEDFVRANAPTRAAVAVQELIDAGLLLPRYPPPTGRQFNCVRLLRAGDP